MTLNLLFLWETIGKIKTKFRILMTKCSLKTCIVLSSFDKEGSLYCDHKKESVLAWKQELTEFHNILIVPKVKDFYNNKTILCTRISEPFTSRLFKN